MSAASRSLLMKAPTSLLRTSPRFLSRQYSDSPYPFTHLGSQATQPKPAPKIPWTDAHTKTVQKSETSVPEKPHIQKPDYGIAVDYRTSYARCTAGIELMLTLARNFSPIPMRVMDGSEPSETVAAAVLSGAPTELQARTVRIYKPARTATQSGDWHEHQWRMDWDILHKGHRWENPLMGWQSSADFMQGTHLNFKSKEDAIRFADKQGYEYFIQEPNERRFIPKAYADQFVHIPKKLKQIRTK